MGVGVGRTVGDRDTIPAASLDRLVLCRGTAGLLFLMLPQSLALWQKIPLLPYLQFPWRLLGPTAGFLAILAGIATQFLLGQSRFGHVPEGEQSRKGSTPSARWNRREVGRLALVVTFITWPILFGLPLTQMPPWLEDFGETSPARVLVIELSGRWLGTTSTAGFCSGDGTTIACPDSGRGGCDLFWLDGRSGESSYLTGWYNGAK